MIQLLSFAFLLLFSSLLLAQEAPPPLSTTSEEVIVTGARYARTQAESPERVTVIDSATIARAVDLGQLLNEQAGIVVNGAYSNPGKDRSIFLRNGANQYTLILVDGQPLIDPSSLGGAVDLRLLSLEGLERIEILRGARSLLYGSDAVAGVINLITAKGSTAQDPFSVHLRAAAQRYGTLEGSVGISGRNEKLDYQVGYAHFTTRGISEATEPDTSRVSFNRDGASRRTFTASLTYRPLEALSIRPALRRATFNGDYDGGSFQDADNTYTNALWLPSLAVDYTQEAYTLGARYNYAATDRVFNDVAFGESPFRGRAQQGDVFGTYRALKNVVVTAGTQVRSESLASGTGTPEDLTATNTSPYLQLNWAAANRLLLEGGYRFNYHSAFGGQSNYSLAASYDLGAVWRLRASYGSAFQSPTLDQLGGPFGANPGLQPQVSTSLEVGAQWSDPQARYVFNLSAFQRNIDDIVVYDFAAGYQNRDALRDRGVELEGSGRLSPTLQVSGNLTYVKGRGVETERFFRRPRTTGFLGVMYRPQPPVLVRLTGSYTGARPDVYFDAAFTRFETDLEPYLLVNAYAEYQFLKSRRLKVFAEVQNLTGTDFVEVTGFSTVGVVPRVGVDWGW